MKAAVILFPGSNRENDVVRALKVVTGANVQIVWHGETELPKGTDLVVLPGGFSYGDYLRCGAIAARSPIMDAILKHANAGGLLLGICNGFQILCETNILPGTLMRNRHLKFNCKNVLLKVENNKSPYTNKYQHGEIIEVPIAHGEGNYFAQPETLKSLEEEGRIAFRYTDGKGHATHASNPNSSSHNIAGILSEKGNVLGLMPHPENAIELLNGTLGGKGLFESLAA